MDRLLRVNTEEGAMLTLNPNLAALHSAHKGMHPVIFTVLAALHEKRTL